MIEAIGDERVGHFFLFRSEGQVLEVIAAVVVGQ